MHAWPLAIRAVIAVLASLVIFIAGGVFLHAIDDSKHPWINAVYWGLTLFAFSWLSLGTTLATTHLRSSAALICFYLTMIAVAAGIGVFFVTRGTVSFGTIALIFAAFLLAKGALQMYHTAKHSPETSQT